jgi:hypothetical protein
MIAGAAVAQTARPPPQDKLEHLVIVMRHGSAARCRARKNSVGTASAPGRGSRCHPTTNGATPVTMLES